MVGVDVCQREAEFLSSHSELPVVRAMQDSFLGLQCIMLEKSRDHPADTTGLLVAKMEKRPLQSQQSQGPSCSLPLW